MTKTRLTLLTLSIVALTACNTAPRKPAPVSERPVGSASTSTSSTAKKADESVYTVKRGDTLYRIALDFGQSYSELVTWNNLANPNDIKVGQVLRVRPPETAAARPAATGGAQVGAVSTASGVETRSLSTPPGAAPVKTGPNGDKKPYSEAAMTEMQKPEAPAVKPVEATDDESVAWMWPAEGRIVSTFDDNKKGIDIAGKSGQAVLAAGAGKVMYAGSGIRGYGNLVIVKHTNTLLSAYAHNKSIAVKEGQTVTRGQKIAEMGDSDTDSVKLHFEIRQQGKPVDPSKFLPPR